MIQIAARRAINRIQIPRLFMNAARKSLHSMSAPKIDPESTQPVQHAVVSTFDLFSIGIGPSSSHTVGPMRAAKIYIEDLISHNLLEKVIEIRIDVYGSLAMTGSGHGTPNAILMGLEGDTPQGIDTDKIITRVNEITASQIITLNKTWQVKFIPDKHMIFHFGRYLPAHPNGMRISSFDINGDILATNEYYSIGGGFVVNEQLRVSHNVYFKEEPNAESISPTNILNKNIYMDDAVSIAPISTLKSKSLITAALPFHNAESLLELCREENLTIAQVVFRNELQWRNEAEVTSKTLNLWNVMNTR